MTQEIEKREDMSQKALMAVSRYLERREYTVLERGGWACPFGEVGIVAYDEDDEALVFVDVEVRCGAEEGMGSEKVDSGRRDRLERTAAFYLASHDDYVNCQVRFDVVSLLVIGEDRALIRHRHNALGDAA